jgi:hypothetical protein
MQLQENEPNQVNQPTQQNAYEEKSVDEFSNLRQNHDLMNNKTKKIFIIICAVAVLAGTLTGFGAFKLKNKNGANVAQVENVVVEDATKVKNGDVFGVQDKDTFAD